MKIKTTNRIEAPDVCLTLSFFLLSFPSSVSDIFFNDDCVTELGSKSVTKSGFGKRKS